MSKQFDLEITISGEQGMGKTTIAHEIANTLCQRGLKVFVDGESHRYKGFSWWASPPRNVNITTTNVRHELQEEHQAIEDTVTQLRGFVWRGKTNAAVVYGNGHSGLGYYVWYQVDLDIPLSALSWRFLGTSREIITIARCIVRHERKAVSP